MKRIGNAFSGVLGGFILIIVGIVLLWWNEGNNVKNLKTTAEMEKVVIDISSDKVDINNDGKLVATNGKLINEAELVDETFNVKVKTPLMKRIVEVYQWEEDSSTDDDGNTTYSYDKKWSSDIIDSSDFHNKKYENPKTKLYEDKEYASNDVKVGVFSLSSNQIKMLSTKESFTEFDTNKVQELKLNVQGKYLTNSKDLDHPEIGDTRILFEYNNSNEISVLAVQQGNTFTSFVSKANKSVNRVMDGTKSGKEMINVIKEEDKFIKWLLRAIGVILCIAGFGAILKPISAITSFVPLLGSIAGAAVGLVSIVLGLCVGFIVIAVAWIRYRPLLGICLLVAVIVLVSLLLMRGKKTKDKNLETNNN